MPSPLAETADASAGAKGDVSEVEAGQFGDTKAGLDGE
jgi:hypothetical protein